jgi:hypothetical protein
MPVSQPSVVKLISFPLLFQTSTFFIGHADLKTNIIQLIVAVSEEVEVRGNFLYFKKKELLFQAVSPPSCMFRLCQAKDARKVT